MRVLLVIDGVNVRLEISFTLPCPLIPHSACGKIPKHMCVTLLLYPFHHLQSLGIMALIPASILIIYLISVLMYLLTRCCDRKSRREKSNGCQKCVLIFFSILCAIAVGAGK